MDLNKGMDGVVEQGREGESQTSSTPTCHNIRIFGRSGVSLLVNSSVSWMLTCINLNSRPHVCIAGSCKIVQRTYPSRVSFPRGKVGSKLAEISA